MINVLVTSVGGGVGQSVVDSISHLESRYHIVGLDLTDSIYSRNQCDDFFISPRITDPSYLDFLLLICKHHNIDILLPGNDGELELLSLNLAKFNNIGVEVVVSPCKIVSSSRNKFDWFVDYSDIINIVPTARYDDYIFDSSKYSNITFPLIAKPAAGSASSGIKIYQSLSEMFGEKIPTSDSKNYVVQPYLMPCKSDPDYTTLQKAVEKRELMQLSEISCQMVFNRDSEIIGKFVSKNSLKNGVPTTIQPITEPSILSVIDNIAEKLRKERVVGPVNIQGRLTENGLVFFEMNLRFTGITGNRAQFGFNEVSAVIDSFLGLVPTQLSFNPSRVGARQVACSTFYPLEQKQYNNLLITGANSWAAKNFIKYLSGESFFNDIQLVLSCRSPKTLLKYLSDTLGELPILRRIQVIGTEVCELSSAVSYCDVLLNFASARPPHGDQKIFDSVVFNASLSDILKLSSVGLVINMSSQSVYSKDGNQPYSEESLTSASSPYSTAKLLSEEMFLSINKFNKNTQVINLRLGRLWAGQLDTDDSQFPSRILDAMLRGGSFNLSHPDNMISLLDVDDLSQIITKLISMWKSDTNIPKLLNLGGVNVTLDELIVNLENVLDRNNISYTPINRLSNNENFSSFVISSELAIQRGVTFDSTLESSWSKMLNLVGENVK